MGSMKPAALSAEDDIFSTGCLGQVPCPALSVQLCEMQKYRSKLAWSVYSDELDWRMRRILHPRVAAQAQQEASEQIKRASKKF